jgi:hypothetical protein
MLIGTVSDHSQVSGSGIHVTLRAVEDCTREVGNVQILTKASELE